MRIRWTPASAADLQHISNYLKEHHPNYRQQTIQRLHQACISLKHAPQRGRIGRVEGTREVLFPPMPYVVVYRVSDEHGDFADLPYGPRAALV